MFCWQQEAIITDKRQVDLNAVYWQNENTVTNHTAAYISSKSYSVASHNKYLSSELKKTLEKHTGKK